MAGVIRGKSRLVLPQATPIGSPTPLASAAVDIPPMSTVEVIRLVSAMLNIVMDRLIFLAFCSHFPISLRKNASVSDNLFNRYVCGSCGAVGFKSG